ncbi:hypothetical protein CTI12_AA486900 [Artemisia annua]|uniref:Uncharacterized protein n=1 Tax=Artemisia annua TaxID=35608 RepID=A0A2U1LIR7_ARTAN|nr:hypothetical protein CTI12_AA486900 [Artemisia annua]
MGGLSKGQQSLVIQVYALPIIAITEAQQEAVFRPPSAAQIHYVDHTTLDAIRERKQVERKTLKNRKKSTKKRQGKYEGLFMFYETL